MSKRRNYSAEFKRGAVAMAASVIWRMRKRLAELLMRHRARGAPEPRWLPQDYLSNCIVLCDRVEIVARLKRGAVIAEVGTDRGEFAKQILARADPRQFHLFDRSFSDFQHSFFEGDVANGRVILHEGDSSTEMSKLPAQTFDWIYIDGDHRFDGVKRDIEQATRLLRPDGVLVFNDYTNYSPVERMHYGVVRAVNDLCLDQNFEIIMLALHPLGYHDVALRRRAVF